MSADNIFSDAVIFAKMLRELHTLRKKQVTSGSADRLRRTGLTKESRKEVLHKTNGRCHICGGTIDADDWQADHVLAHSSGGENKVDNFLPAHSICNNYRWHYGAEEFQWILKLGVWMRTQIERETKLGLAVGERFCEHERRRNSRRKAKPHSVGT